MVVRAALRHLTARGKENKTSAALFLLASVAYDLDIVGDISFYFKILNDSPPKALFVIPFCVIGILFWLASTTMCDLHRTLRPNCRTTFDTSKVHLIGIFLQDIPQIVLTFSLDSNGRSSMGLSNIGVFNILTAIYGALSKLAEFHDQQDDPLVSADCTASFSGHAGEVYTVATLPGGQMVATGSYDRTVKLWDIESGTCLNTFEGHTNMVRAVAAVSPTMIVSGSRDKTVRLWDITTGECVQVLIGHTHRVRAVSAVSQSLVASGASDRTIKLWNVATGACVRTFEGHTDSVNAIVCARVRDIETLVSASSDNLIKLWDLQTGECTRSLSGHSDSVNAVAIVRGAGLIASASDDRYVKLWNAVTGDCINSLEGHTHWVYSVASVSPEIIVSGSRDKTVKLWDITTGMCVKTLKGHSSWVDCVTVVSPEIVASTSDDATVKLWHLRLKRSFEMVTHGAIYP